jgi:hypothetical protein
MRSTGLKVHNLTFGSLFKIMFAASMVFWGISGIIFGVSAFFGADTVSWNDTNYYGVTGLITGLVLMLIFGAIFGGLGAVISAFCLKLFGAILPLGELRTHVSAERDNSNS